jgi:hypothetical protein
MKPIKSKSRSDVNSETKGLATGTDRRDWLQWNGKKAPSVKETVNFESLQNHQS